MKRAFTFIEVMVVMGIMSILFVMTTPSLFSLKDRNTLQNTTTELMAHLRQQQYYAMNDPVEYGVYFEQSGYTLFKGRNYVPGSIENVKHTLSYPLSFSTIRFPQGTVVFASGSGEVIGYSQSASTVILTDTVHLVERSITLNSLGVPSMAK